MSAISTVSEKQILTGNVIAGTGHIALGAATAYTINKLAHYLFGFHEQSNASYVAKTVAFAAGVAASIYLAPLTTIYSWTGIEACKILGMSGATVVISANFFNEELASKLCAGMAMASLGPIVGLGGRVALISFGAIGAAIGAIF